MYRRPAPAAARTSEQPKRLIAWGLIEGSHEHGPSCAAAGMAAVPGRLSKGKSSPPTGASRWDGITSKGSSLPGGLVAPKRSTSARSSRSVVGAPLYRAVTGEL